MGLSQRFTCLCHFLMELEDPLSFLSFLFFFFCKKRDLTIQNYYPPCSRSDFVLGISPHPDSDIGRSLWQDDEVPGLQIRHKDE
uniref:Isopenicillin N synthase-like Fe(2+) 2OG dioxygenase domain-containing protein n=1 Tax=Gossypium raimondii TaxID=29730 RepID=A0A0D2MFQ5_GOSRA|nr:hypothetical protein B456_002G249000 [Gossypium raimondii]